MSKKYFMVLVCSLSSLAYADNALSESGNPNFAFQQFQNEYNIGYGMSKSDLINGSYSTSSVANQSLNIEVEHLFDVGVWFDVNFNMLTSSNQQNLGVLNGGNGSYTGNPMYNNGAAFNQEPFVFTFQAKAGYAFNLIPSTLQLTPYLMLGRNSNWATSTVLANEGQSLTADYFYTGALGARLSYRINDVVLVYADEAASYNWDNSGAVKYVQTSPAYYGKSYAATNYDFTSTIGAKFNVYKALQIGANVYWSNFQPQSNISGLMYTPTDTRGAEVSIGLTY